MSVGEPKRHFGALPPYWSDSFLIIIGLTGDLCKHMPMQTEQMTLFNSSTCPGWQVWVRKVHPRNAVHGAGLALDAHELIWPIGWYRG